MMREALIDRAAITNNVETLRAAVGGVRCMVVVKADGYGHGAVESARAALAGGADWLGVVDVTEALELRSAGIDAPVLTWLHDPEADFTPLVEARVDIGVSYRQQLERAAEASGRAVVHLKVDTGLARNGAPEAQWHEFFETAAALERSGRITVRGVWSHLANAGDANDAAQVASFEAALEAARSAGLDPELAHLAATGGALRVPSARFDLVRLGVSAYGLSPFGQEDAAALGLRPAMELAASVVSAKRVPAGTGVSYGHEYVTTEETTLALIPLGYGDGIPRHASSRGPVSIGGARYRIAGRVAMDLFVVDVGDAPVKVGDRAVLFGDPATGVPSADDWAAAAETINYEIVTRIGSRVPRRYVP
jgi:alanine racemase